MADLEDLDVLSDSSGNSLFDTVLQIGLFLGAIFQMICIFSVILIPQKVKTLECIYLNSMP